MLNTAVNLINQYPELSILLINFVIILIAYFYLYPKFVKNDFSKLWKYDIFTSLFALYLAGILFWGSGVEFNLLFFSTNWFVFSILSLALIESFFFFKYAKRQNINLSFAPQNFEKSKKQGTTTNDGAMDDTANKEPIYTYTDESKEGFIYGLHNFEKLFAKNLTPSKENSVEIFFVEIAKEFIEGLQEIDFGNYKNFDDKESFFEVDDEGQTRIFLAHKKDLGMHLNGIEIYISNEIAIEFFQETHAHFAVVGNKFYFTDSNKVNKNEERWEYSEIDEAVEMLKDAFSRPTKFLRTTWRGHLLESGIWDKKRRGYSSFNLIRPIILIQRIFQPWIRKEEKIVYVDWKPKVENQTTITEKEILEKLKNFLEQKISRKELADWAKNIDTLFDKQKIKYNYYELDDAIYAMMEAEVGIDKLTKKIKESKNGSLAQGVLISFEEEDYNLQKEEVEKIIKWLEGLR